MSLRTIQKYDKDLIPKKRKPIYACYDNKKIKNWTSDDFAEYIFDNSNALGKLVIEGTFFKKDDTILDYIEHSPNSYKRCYLYGVWEIFKDFNHHWRK